MTQPFPKILGISRHIPASHRQHLMEPGITSADGYGLRQPWNEHAVACGLQAGNREAWTLLFEHNSVRVWKYVARLMGRDPAGVADVVQETFLAAAHSARTYDVSRGTLGQWLLGIAHRQAAQYLRRNKTVNEGVAAEILSREADPVACLEQQELAEIVRRVLTELSADYAVLLVGKYAEHRSIEQLVSELGGTTESIRSRLARARREFQTIFERLAKPGRVTVPLTNPH